MIQLLDIILQGILTLIQPEQLHVSRGRRKKKRNFGYKVYVVDAEGKITATNDKGNVKMVNETADEGNDGFLKR